MQMENLIWQFYLFTANIQMPKEKNGLPEDFLTGVFSFFQNNGNHFCGIAIVDTSRWGYSCQGTLK